MTTKTCSRCGTAKRSAQFYRSNRTNDGLFAWCRTCCAEYQYNRRHPKVPRTTPLQASDPVRGTSVIPIRPDRAVIVSNIPADLSRAEAARIARILISLAVDEGTNH